MILNILRLIVGETAAVAAAGPIIIPIIGASATGIGVGIGVTRIFRKEKDVRQELNKFPGKVTHLLNYTF